MTVCLIHRYRGLAVLVRSYKEFRLSRDLENTAERASPHQNAGARGPLRSRGRTPAHNGFPPLP